MSEIRDFEIDGYVTTADPVVTRDSDGDGGAGALVLEGYAAVFGQRSEQMGYMIETIDRDAFDSVLADDPDVRFLASHGGLAMARTSNGSMQLEADDHGLRFRAELNPDAQIARDLHALIERGDVTQMSFGFRAKWRREEHGDDCGDDCEIDHVAIREVTWLGEVSAVTFAAYPQTEVGARADDELLDAVATDDESAGTGEIAARLDLTAAEIEIYR